MKRLFCPAVVCLFLAAGCAAAFNSRVAERRAAFDALTADQQDRIRYGEIEDGFSTDQVYIALGHPSTVQTAVENGVNVEVWSYRNISAWMLRKPRTRHGGAAGVMAKGASAWPESQPSGLSAHGDVVDQPRSSGSTGGAEAVDVPTSTLRILFRAGKVAGTRLDP